MMKHRLSLVLALAALSLASACSQTTAGSPEPSSSSGQSAPASVGGSAAPTISHPLDPTAYLNRTCDLVPQQLVTQLGYTNATPTGEDSSFGPGCGWVGTDTLKPKNFNVSIEVLNGKRNGGLPTIYKARDRGFYAFAEPTTVSGYPAAYADLRDRRAQGKCTVFVGIADDLTFATGVDGYTNAQDSCDTAKQIAAAVITTLQGG